MEEIIRKKKTGLKYPLEHPDKDCDIQKRNSMQGSTVTIRYEQIEQTNTVVHLTF